MREREPFKVNFTRTEVYKKSTIPTCQRLLNNYYMKNPERLGQGHAPVGEEGDLGGEEWREGGGEERRGGGGEEGCRGRPAGV